MKPTVEKLDLLHGIQDRECPRCRGAGRVADDRAIGDRFRTLRKSHGISGRELARKMGYSAAYIGDLELGRRQWSSKLMSEYFQALQT